MDWGYIVRRQSDLLNTKESILLVCDKPYYTKKWIQQSGRKLKFCGTMHRVVNGKRELCFKTNILSHVSRFHIKCASNIQQCSGIYRLN